MKLSVKITLIIVSLVLLAIVLTVCICSSIANRINDTSEPPVGLSSWMSMIKDETLLKQVAIPGAHDAGSNGMAWFSKTQSRNIDDQLACGTRYFDLRVKVKDGEARIYHGPAVSLYLKDILKQAHDFLINNPSEVIMLDFQKFAKDDAKKMTLDLLEEHLGDMVLVNNKDISDLDYFNTLTLGEVRKKCIVFWGVIDENVNRNDVFLRNDNEGKRDSAGLQSYYERNWNWYYSSEKYIKKALPAYINKYKASNGGLFVLQGQLTDGALIIGPRYREGGHEKNMNNYVTSLWNSEDLKHINIIMRDFISPSKNMLTLSLNIPKNIVKEDCEDAFYNLVGIVEQVIVD